MLPIPAPSTRAILRSPEHGRAPVGQANPLIDSPGGSLSRIPASGGLPTRPPRPPPLLRVGDADHRRMVVVDRPESVHGSVLVSRTKVAPAAAMLGESFRPRIRVPFTASRTAPESGCGAAVAEWVHRRSGFRTRRPGSPESPQPRRSPGGARRARHEIRHGLDLGSIEPLPNCPEAMNSRASSTVMVSSQRCWGAEVDGDPRHPVGIINNSALRSWASRPDAMSLSTNGSTPDDDPVGSRRSLGYRRRRQRRRSPRRPEQPADQVVSRISVGRGEGPCGAIHARRPRRWSSPAEAAISFGLGLEEGADRFRRVLECRVVQAHHRVGRPPLPLAGEPGISSLRALTNM